MPFRTYVPLSRSLQAAQRRPGGLGSRVVPNSQPAARTLSEWSRIEAVTVGTRTEVQLHDDEAPPDSRRVMGRFHSATADTLTLTRYYQMLCMTRDQAASFLTPSTKGTPSMTSAIN